MMKFKLQLLFILILTVGISGKIYSQELGIRMGDTNGGNIAVDGVFSTGKLTRIHTDLSFGNGIGADVLWDFIYKPLGVESFKWYAGVGPTVYLGNDLTLLGAVGELGIEYHFDEVPIAIGLDWRPYLEIVENTDLWLGGFGFNIRYVFHK